MALTLFAEVYPAFVFTLPYYSSEFLKSTKIFNYKIIFFIERGGSFNRFKPIIHRVLITLLVAEVTVGLFLSSLK